jgi:hypothetical protein
MIVTAAMIVLKTPRTMETASTPSTSRIRASTDSSTRSWTAAMSVSSSALRRTTTSTPSLLVAKSSSNVFPMVSVRIIVPAMNATPSTTARPVSMKRTLWAQRPL